MCDNDSGKKINKTETINFKLAKDERDKLALMAKLAGKTVSVLIRDAICEKYGDSFLQLDSFKNGKDMRIREQKEIDKENELERQKIKARNKERVQYREDRAEQMNNSAVA